MAPWGPVMDTVLLAREFAHRACIARSALPAEFGEAPDGAQRPAWEEHLARRGFPAPEAFLALLDEEGEHLLDFGGWGVLSPEASAYYAGLFAESHDPLPMDGVYGAMVPLFCRDGDLLLLAADGAVYGYLHDGDTEVEPPVAPSFEALLRTLLDVLDGRAEYPLDLLSRAVERSRRARSAGG